MNMEFLQTIKNTIHGWSEETRKFLAMVTMGIGLLVFFSLWLSSVSSRLVAIGPSVAAPRVLPGEALPAPTAFLPPRDNFGAEEAVGSGAPEPTAQIPILQQPLSEPAPTPIAGIAETFGGLQQLFRTTDSPDIFSVQGLWRLMSRVVAAMDDFLRAFGGFLYQKASTLIAS